MPTLEVTMERVDELVPYARNAKVHTNQQIDKIATSIEEFGFNDPVAVWHNPDGKPEIVEGHGRVLAAKKLGIESVPVITLDALTDEQRRAYALVHNKLTMSTDFDFAMLALELEAIDMDMSGFGFDMDTDGFGSEQPEVVDAEVPDIAPKRVSSGDVWKLGEHRLMCGDSSNMDDMKVLVAGSGSPMMVFTDPPYGVAIGDKNRVLNTMVRNGKGKAIEDNIIGDTLGTEELRELLVRCFSNLRDVCDESCSYYVSSPQGGELGLMMQMMKDAGLPVRHNLIWAKNAATFSMGRLDYDYKHEPIFYTWTKRHVFYGNSETSLLEFDKPLANRLHPTMKPVALVVHLMENSSREGDTVIDIFGGSGTTLIAAEQLGRKCLMMEIDPHYCDVIIKRWEDLTGGKAEKVA